MYCPNCGSPVDEHQICCISCGKKIDHFDHDTYTPYQKSRPIWFYFIVIATLILSFWGFYSLYNSGKTLENIVDVQLTEIRNRQLTKSYYEYSSNEFKKNTSFDAFRNFIEKNSALSNFTAVKILNSKQDSNFGVVLVELTQSDNTRIPVKYEFIREDGEWRILRIEIEDHSLSHDAVENEQYIEPIKTQLAAIKERKLEKAYQEPTSDEFKKNTSFSQFKEFIGKFPIITNHEKIDFLKSSLKNNQATVTIVLHEAEINLPIEYTLTHQEGKWQIWSMRIITPSLDHDNSENQNTALLLPPVTKMLAQIKSNDLKSAYQGTSTGFKAVTSYEKFENFLKKFPSFKEGTYTIKNKNINHGVGKVEVEISNTDQTTHVEYTLSKDHDTWIIWGIQVVKQTSTPKIDHLTDTNTHFDETVLTKEISGLLNNIKNKDFKNAYQDYTSAEFRNVTSYDQFTKFVEQNQIFLKQKKATFDNLTFDNNIGTIKALITTSDGNVFNVKFDLIKEEQRWKILGIKILTNDDE